jgi:hypothetical protein
MPPVPENLAGPAGRAVVNDYDSFAEAYSAENEVNLFNAYYERPATLALAGDVTGRRILDAGCGSGPLFAALRAVLGAPSNRRRHCDRGGTGGKRHCLRPGCRLTAARALRSLG